MKIWRGISSCKKRRHVTSGWKIHGMWKNEAVNISPKGINIVDFEQDLKESFFSSIWNCYQ